MGYCIIKLDGKYMEWTSVSDSPRSPLLPKEQFIRYWEEEYGRYRMWELPRLLKQADETGTSALGHTVNEIIRGNQAGVGGKRLTKRQIIQVYTINGYDFELWCKRRNARVAKEFREELEKRS